MQNFTSVILYMNIICVTHCLCGAILKSLHSSDVLARREKRSKTESLFQANTCLIFYREIMTSFINYVTATLRALFA